MPKSMTEILAEMAQKQAAKAAAAPDERRKLMESMLKQGINYIHIDFAGSGDSGSIETIMVGRTGTDDKEEVQFNSDLHTEISDWAYSYLESTNIDWYNNDGGQGEIEIDMSQPPFMFSCSIDVNQTISNNALSIEEPL